MAQRRLTQKKILQLHQRMIKHASMAGNWDPEGIASQYVINLMEGSHKKATIGQAYIDILRDLGGRKGSSGYEKRQALNNAYNPKGMAFVPDESADLDVDDRITLIQALELVTKPRLKWILGKRLEGKNNREIADEYGCTESYVHQLVQKELKRIGKILRA